MITSRTSLVSLGIVVLLGLGVAACGDDAAPAAPPAASAESPDPVAAPPADTDDGASRPVTGSDQVAVVASPEPEETAAPPDPTPSSAQVAVALPVLDGEEKLAPELVGISGWVNTEPFTLASLRGKVVLIDIWTYTCINCIRTLPYLKAWYEKYSDQGLVIVGVHTPEFEFEKIKSNVEEAVAEYGLKWPIAQDNDFDTWDAFENRFWPAKYLIDKDGYIRYTHFGEGAYEETEAKIRELLRDAGLNLAGTYLDSSPEREVDLRAFTRDPLTRITRELYAGVKRNYGAAMSGSSPPYVAHDKYYREPKADILYEDPGEHLNQYIYLQGLWHNGLESLTHARETQDLEDYMVIEFLATSVNVVMSPEGGAPFEVRVTIDGAPFTPDQAGADVMFDEDGNSYVLVNDSRMYRIVDIPEYGSHKLKMTSNSADFSVFAFTFGAFMRDPDS